MDINYTEKKNIGIGAPHASLAAYAAYAAIAVYAAFLLGSPKEVAIAARDGVQTCIYTLIPSLFPFLVLSRLLVASGMTDRAAACVRRLLSRVLHLAPSLAGAYLCGLAAGFPSGGIAVCEAYLRGDCDKDEAEFALGVCHNAGCGFVIGAVSAMTGDIKRAAMLYLLQIPATLLAANAIFALSGQKGEKASTAHPPRRQVQGRFEPSAAITSSVASMAQICGFVIFFSVVNRLLAVLLDRVGASGTLHAAALALTELACAAKGIARLLPGNAGFVLFAFAVGWSGLCVLMQVRAFCSRAGLSMRRCVCMSILKGGIMAIFAWCATLFSA